MPKNVLTRWQGAWRGNSNKTSSHHYSPSEAGVSRTKLSRGGREGHNGCHSPAASAWVGEQEEVPDLEWGLSWWRSHWTHRLPWGACSSAGRCVHSEGSGRTWTAVAQSSLPQTACMPSLQCKERSHSLLLVHLLQLQQQAGCLFSKGSQSKAMPLSAGLCCRLGAARHPCCVQR